VRAAGGRAQQVRELRRPLRRAGGVRSRQQRLDLDHSGNVIFVPAQSGSGIAVSATVRWRLRTGDNFTRIASYTNFGTSR